METKHKEAKQGNYIYSCGRTGETGKIDYEKRVLTQQFCHEWASVENQEKKGCSYSSDSKVHKKENEDLPKHLKKKKMTRLLYAPYLHIKRCLSRLWLKKNYEEPKLPNHGILGAQHLRYAYIKKVFFSSHHKAKVSCLWHAFCVCCYLVEYHWHTHNVHNNLIYFVSNSTFLFKTLQESQVEMNHLLLPIDHKMILKSRYMKALY